MNKKKGGAYIVIPPSSKYNNEEPIKILMKSYLNNCCPKDTYVYYATMQSYHDKESDLKTLMNILSLVEEVPGSEIYYYMAYNLLTSEVKTTNALSNIYCPMDFGYSINIDADIV